MAVPEVLLRFLQRIGRNGPRRDIYLGFGELPDVSHVRRSLEADLVRGDAHLRQRFERFDLHLLVERCHLAKVNVGTTSDKGAGIVSTDVHYKHPERRVGRCRRRHDHAWYQQVIRDECGMDGPSPTAGGPE